jgi:putative hydrolase of the HAD superfamily
MPVIRAVLFDLDNTLVDRDAAFSEFVHAQFIDPDVRTELLSLDNGGRGDRTALFQRWRQHSGKVLSQSVLGTAIADRLQPDEELIETLGTLSRTMKLGIITNGSGETQRRKIKAAGLDKVLASDRIWISDEVGTAKPDPAIFLLASTAVGVSPEQCLFIGDREREDQAGALAAGMHARLVKSVLTASSLVALLGEVEAA